MTCREPADVTRSASPSATAPPSRPAAAVWTGMAAAVLHTALLLVAVRAAPAATLSLDQCDQALGMETGDIADDQLSASSSHNVNSVGPRSGRIRTEHRGGAWCPLPVITDRVHEYLQIDLGRDTVVTAAETQGRFGNGRGVEWAEHYSLEYWRDGAEGDTGWRTYRNASGHTVLEGNVNSYLAQKTLLDPPLVASRVRVVPRSSHPRTVCLRAELHGCPYTAGVDSYSMDPPDVRFPDLTYDGVREAEVMKKGLGQLTDGQAGNNDITRPEWVGWKRTPGQLVTLTFRFTTLRELEAVTFHTSNRFTSNVRIFSRASVSFSVDGTSFMESTTLLEPAPDRIFEDSRLLKLPLHRQLARRARVQLTAADRWLLLSEVTFHSEPSAANVTRPGQGEPAGGGAPVLAAGGGGSNTSLAVTLGVLGLVLLLLSALVGYVVRAGRRRKVAGGPGPTPLPLPRTLNRKELSLNMQLTAGSGAARAQGDVYGAAPMDEDKVGLCEPYRLVRLHPEYPSSTQRTSRNERHLEMPYEYAVPVDTSTPPPPFSDCVATMRSAASSWDNPTYRQSPSVTTGSSSHPSLCNIGELLPTLPPPPAAAEGWRHRVTAETVAGLTGACVWRSDRAEPAPNVTDISAELIKRRDKLGEGRFGEIYSCEVHFASSPSSPYQAPSRLATARCLRTSAPADAGARLRREADPLARVTDPHVTRLLGICVLDESPCLLVEYMERGDLHQCLRRQAHQPDRSQPLLDYGSLLYMATQVAAGMKHLEGLGIVHRDLAARNCLVGRQLQVKVGDLGPSRTQYASDYVTLNDGRVIPLRWHAPEALFDAESSSAADVWSFSVALWEMLTWCRVQPMSHLSDSAVTDRLAAQRRSSSCEPLLQQPGSCPQPLLQQPASCPREIFDLMCECWRSDPETRPTFSEIHMFLQRKNLGFDPAKDAA